MTQINCTDNTREAHTDPDFHVRVDGGVWGGGGGGLAPEVQTRRCCARGGVSLHTGPAVKRLQWFPDSCSSGGSTAPLRSGSS